jgi:phage shock protein PspC (stress-responsive transcriptional regulator)
VRRHRDVFRPGANVVRLLVVLGTILGLGVLIFVYVAAWLLLPEG